MTINDTVCYARIYARLERERGRVFGAIQEALARHTESWVLTELMNTAAQLDAECNVMMRLIAKEKNDEGQ